MKIVADENIPMLDEYFSSQADIIKKPGRKIVRDDLVAADILLVRSVTKVDHQLLQDTPVKFVGTATTGIDHLDVDWLQQHDILWASADGCNVNAVVQYVLAVVAALQLKRFLPERDARAAVIGVGKIGSRVAGMLQKLGFSVWLCDPLRAEQEKNFPHIPLEQLTDVDFITIHTPLTTTGLYLTYHLLQKDFFTRQKERAIIVNTSRGAVINFADLKQYGHHLHWCLDVWEYEPVIDLAVLERAEIATPHIAGYSLQAKLRATEMIYQALVKQGFMRSNDIKKTILPEQKIITKSWRENVLKIFNPLFITKEMKEKLRFDTEHHFDVIRKQYQNRLEFDVLL